MEELLKFQEDQSNFLCTKIMIRDFLVFDLIDRYDIEFSPGRMASSGLRSEKIIFCMAREKNLIAAHLIMDLMVVLASFATYISL